jgi:hypothetical protein
LQLYSDILRERSNAKEKSILSRKNRNPHRIVKIKTYQSKTTKNLLLLKLMLQHLQISVNLDMTHMSITLEHTLSRNLLRKRKMSHLSRKRIRNLISMNTFEK